MKKISVKLIIGILAIVLASTALSGLLYATMYKSVVIDEKTKDLMKRGEQVAVFSTSLLDEDEAYIKKVQIVKLIEKLTDAKIWIVNEYGDIVLSSEGLKNNIIIDLNGIKLGEKIGTQEFSNYFGQSTLTVGIPMYVEKNFAGMVLLHTPINDMYGAYGQYKEDVFKILLLTTFLSVVLGIFYSKLFTINIEKMKKATIEISKGNYNVRTGVKSEDEIGELAKTLDNMAFEIERKIIEIEKLEKMSKELVANVSHEFKTPLTLIRGYVENIQDGVLEPSEEVYKKIINNTKTLEKMVNEVLDLSKLESGKVELKSEMFELDMMLDGIIKDMSIIAQKKNVEVVFEKKTTENVLISADYDKLKQVLVIFIDNAIKYSNEEGKVEVKLSSNEINIKDNGVGIRKEELEHIFDRFYQADKSRKKEGYGLGLCIAKHILDMHGYLITVESEENKGTEIKVILKTTKEVKK